MKHCIYLIVFLVLSFSAKAQKNVDEGKIFLLHPSVGLTITVDDKTKYNLFPQYIDSVF